MSIMVISPLIVDFLDNLLYDSKRNFSVPLNDRGITHYLQIKHLSISDAGFS